MNTEKLNLNSINESINQLNDEYKTINNKFKIINENDIKITNEQKILKNTLDNFKESIIQENNETQNQIKLCLDQINNVNLKYENLEKLELTSLNEKIKNKFDNFEKIISKIKISTVKEESIDKLKDLNNLILENKNQINILSSYLQDNKKKENNENNEINKVINEINEKMSLQNKDYEKYLNEIQQKLVEINEKILLDKNDVEIQFKSIWDTLSLIFQNNNMNNQQK